MQLYHICGPVVYSRLLPSWEEVSVKYGNVRLIPSFTPGWCIGRTNVYNSIPSVIFHLDKSATYMYIHVYIHQRKYCTAQVFYAESKLTICDLLA